MSWQHINISCMKRKEEKEQEEEEIAIVAKYHRHEKRKYTMKNDYDVAK